MILLFLIGLVMSAPVVSPFTHVNKRIHFIPYFQYALYGEEKEGAGYRYIMTHDEVMGVRSWVRLELHPNNVVKASFQNFDLWEKVEAEFFDYPNRPIEGDGGRCEPE